ncbi:cryptic autophosphorylating protein tyrosine kinase Etk [Pirellulimonas nuda]|uniref:Cryptic autophosphorylating protein tyrosine kinase Etk n=1 Tax=Pirellulimonas nuda TaxID=2528009 RepID=A0A518DCX5_9BACT|nr:CpsD/CapB family tyrosine-protein kinase [Pirellulimonas nuda]QDU89331.1 cryptic autophosphorylating protein tyrosine kinase Etk [Pirellulimonas nuda]
MAYEPREVRLAPESPLVLDRMRPAAATPAGEDAVQDSFVLEVIRKRWWLLALCALAGAGGAYFLAQEFGKQTAVVHGSLMYGGLPLPPGPSVYQPPSLTTYQEILFSIPSMQRICDQHGLEMPPGRLAEMFKCKVGRGSSIMELQLQWANPADGVAMVNDTMQLLIDEAARRRKAVLGEHMRHVESVQLTARSEVDQAEKRLRDARRARAELLREQGLASDPTDDFSAQRERMLDTQAALEQLAVSKKSLEEQLRQTDGQILGALGRLQQAHVNARVQFLDGVMQRYRQGTKTWDNLNQLKNRLEALSKAPLDSVASYTDWKTKLAQIDLEAPPVAGAVNVAALGGLDRDLQSLTSRRVQLEYGLIPLQHQQVMLETRLADIEAPSAAPEATGAAMPLSVGEEFGEEERQLAAAENRYNLVKQQLENMRQVEACRTQEFSVHMPASLATTQVDSNKKKMFVMFAAAIAGALALPVFGVEWLARRQSPVVQFASRWGLPVIAERLLANYQIGKNDAPDWRFDQAVRMATLRIQQSANRSGFVVLFSNLGQTAPPARLMTAIAECLAHREERVLVVDAMCPSLGRRPAARPSHAPHQRLLPLTNPNGQRLTAAPSSQSSDGSTDEQAANDTALATRYGLSEFLSRECEDVADLIQPTGCPGVDQISAGDMEFPREAMASSCFSELFEHCRNTYSVILVAGPPVVARADFQMLAARADGILLAASGAAVKDPASRAAVQDLIELRAPMLGIVS